LFLAIDLVLLAANVFKIPSGGYVPLGIAVCIMAGMMTWSRGRTLLARINNNGAMPLDAFLGSLLRGSVQRVPGTAIFLTGDNRTVPGCLLHNLKHNKVLHEQLVFLSVKVTEVPTVPQEERLKLDNLGDMAWRATLRYGFKESPNVPADLRQAADLGVKLDVMHTTYFLGHSTIVPGPRRGMMGWQKILFAWLMRNARNAPEYFNLPPNRVVELGAQVEL
jgi:KUP system potassium uptake protein